MRAAVLQMVSGPELAENLKQAAALLEEAAQAEARLTVLPENFAYFAAQEADKYAVAESPGHGEIQTFLSEQAKLQQQWIVAGSVPLRSPGVEKIFAACLVYAPSGECVARYDKLHLFDVDLPDGSERYRESDRFLPGKQCQLVPSDVGCLGLSICYDLRFPELYRGLSQQGAELFTVPSAFTQATGEAHWAVLLRARAIENQAYVLAANQGGTHPGGRQTFGGSMIVDPWGAVLVQVDKGSGIAVADIDLGNLRSMRQRFPVLQHRRILTSTEVLND